MRTINKDNFKALALGILIALVFSSCMTNRKGQLTTKGKNFIAEHCKGFDSISENTVLVYKDTTIYLPGKKGETIYLSSPCDSLKPLNIVKHKNGLTSSVKTVGKTIEFDCEADSLKAVIKTLERKTQIVKKERVVIEKPCELEHLSKWDSFWIRTGQILLLILLLFVAFKCLKTYLKAYLPFIK